MSHIVTRRCFSVGTRQSSKTRRAETNTLVTNQSDASLRPTSQSHCGNGACQKPVKTGIECTLCGLWYHSACTEMDLTSFRKHLTEPLKPWFCPKCLEDPVAKCVAAMSSHFEMQLAQYSRELQKLQKELETLRLTNAPPQTASPLVPRSKRPRVSPTPLPKHTASSTTEDSPAITPATHTTVDLPTETDPTASDDSMMQSEVTPLTNVPVTTEWRTVTATQRVKHNKQSAAPRQKRNDHENSQDTLTVICSQVPEPQSNSLATRRSEELEKWTELCTKIGVNITPVALTRLTRNKDSPHAAEPRLLRVKLNNMLDVETILLASHVLKGDTKARIYPDIPWSERHKLRTTEPKELNSEKNQRSIFIHGVPELEDDDKLANYLHDCGEWSYIQQLLKLDTIMATDVYRLPRSVNYRGSEPRILKVTLFTRGMVTATLEKWYLNKQLAPELRIRPSLTTGAQRPTETQHQLQPSQNGTTEDHLVAELSPAKPKNPVGPVHSGPANPCH